MAQANQYFATQIRGPMPAMQDAQEYGIRNTLAQQQGILFQQAQQDRSKAQENDTLFKNALVQFLGPANASMVTGDAGVAPTAAPAMGPPDAGMGQVSAAPPNPAGQQQNALSQMIQADPQRAIQFAQYQQDQQRQAMAFQQAQAEARRVAMQRDANQKYLQAQYYLNTENPGTTIKIADPAAYENMARAGVDMEDSAAVKRALTGVMAHFGPIAGVAPEKQESVALAEGAELVDPKTGRKIARNPKDMTASNREAADKTFQRANVLRDEYNNQVKDFAQVQSQYQNIVATSAEPSSAGDISLIFSYMKMLDPASTVREGEFATAQNSGSAFNRVGAMYNKIISGERLTGEQRADFTKQAANLFGTRLKQKEKVAKKYTDFATKTGVDPSLVIGGPEEAGTPAATLPDGWSVTEAP